MNIKKTSRYADKALRSTSAVYQDGHYRQQHHTGDYDVCTPTGDESLGFG